MALAQRLDTSLNDPRAFTRPTSGARSARTALPRMQTTRLAVKVRRPAVDGHEGDTVSYDDHGLVVTPAAPRLDAGSHVWLELLVDSRPMRVLAETIGENELGTHFRFKHFWPQDRSRYDAAMAYPT